jgi:DNA-binding response OmpR family regulator
VQTRVECLESGAGDFLVKPFVLMELRARVHAQLRSIHSPTEQGLAACGLVLDRFTRTLVVDGREVTLTTRECQLLAHLMSKPDTVCSREELLAEVWELSFDPGTNLVDACVRRLRSKMNDDTIETVRNVGYALRSA